MAHLSPSLPLSRESAPATGSVIERVILGYVLARASRALAAVQRHHGLEQRLALMLRGRRVPSRPTLRWFLEAQLTCWSTREDLSFHDDRMLADVEIPRSMIKHVATLSAFGWPPREKAPSADSGAVWSAPGRFRRAFFPTQDEVDEAYLAGAVDIYDLESRMAEITRRASATPRF